MNRETWWSIACVLSMCMVLQVSSGCRSYPGRTMFGRADETSAHARKEDSPVPTLAAASPAQSLVRQLPPVDSAPRPGPLTGSQTGFQAESEVVSGVESQLALAPVVSSASPDVQSPSAPINTLAEASPIVPIQASAALGELIDLTVVPASEVQLASAAEPTVSTISSNAQSSTNLEAPVGESATIELTIENVRPGRGAVKVAVFVDPNQFLKKDGSSQVFELADTSATASKSLDVKRPCAIAVFQDIDGNGELTRNRTGIPVEPCAFSGGAVIKRGPPAFNAAVIQPGQPGRPVQCVICLP